MKKYVGKITVAAILILLVCVTFFVGSIAPKVLATVTTANELAVTNPEIKSYTLVYAQIWSYDGAYVYDTTANSEAGGWTAVASATYANTDIAVTVDSGFYVGQLAIPTNVRSKRVVVRLMGSADATADKDDTQITAFAMYYDNNGWTRWPGPELVY